MDAGVRYGSFSLRTQCSHCGQPLPLHGPSLRVTCSYCLEQVQLPTALWRAVLDEFEERDTLLGDGERVRRTKHVDGIAIHLEVGRELPECENCQVPFAVDALEVGRDHNFACVGCGDPASTHAAPQWLRELVPTVRQSYSTDPDADAAGKPSLSPPEHAVRPVVMQCPQCGGTLQATETSERILGCRYCGADVYLPDEVWRRLHPVKTVQRWYLRFEGTTRTMLAAQREAEERAQREYADRERAQRMETSRELARQQKERDVADSKRRAWRAAWTLLAAMLVGVAINGGVLGLPRFAASSTATVTAVSVVVACVAVLLVAVHRVGKPIQRRTGHDKDWMVFCTWFWLPFVMFFPAIGSLFGLARAFVLARGKFAASTITTNGSSRSYAAVALAEGEGRPAAVVFAALAVLWPLLAASTLVVFAT